ncbi:hypothetical protein [Moorena sp. SIO3A5]|uniref:hypothetical protein n=1 Tax=Moorena sp. SIO3A5 TaxID=2607822 RepID=UPI00257B6F6F|nr:hypothetical protein [Moorena sp. SIO3A5]
MATLLEMLCGTGFGLGLSATLREWPRCANDAETFPISCSRSVRVAHKLIADS